MKLHITGGGIIIMGKLPTHLTIGDKYRPAMTITDQVEADAYFEKLVAHTERSLREDGTTQATARTEAEQIERGNLGYFAGYYDHETRARVERLFHCAHPIFGSIAENGPPTPEQAFMASVVLVSGEGRGAVRASDELFD